MNCDSAGVGDRLESRTLMWWGLSSARDESVGRVFGQCDVGPWFGSGARASRRRVGCQQLMAACAATPEDENGKWRRLSTR